MIAKFNIEDRVILTTLRYGNSPENPVSNSSYSCGGTVICSIGGTNSIQVRWDNGKINSYIAPDLKLITSHLQPKNKCKSIW